MSYNVDLDQTAHERADPEVIKLFSCSTQQSMKFKLIINIIIAQIIDILRVKPSNPFIIPPVYEVYRGYIVFVFSVRMFVCKLFSVKDIYLRNYLT